MNDMEKILEKVTVFVRENKRNIIDDLCTLCKIPSVATKGEDGFIFGKAVDDALNCAKDICEKHGVSCEVKHDLGYALSYCGKGDGTVGFFAHCDVVPAAEDEWVKTKPFVPYFDGTHLFCRGSEDNKAAAIGGIYISKMINSKILPMNNTFMCYFGGNEECGMGDLENFLKNEKIPELSLVPDNGYPVCVGEKGIARFRAEAKKPFESITKFDGGNVVNAVIGTLVAEIKYEKSLFDELSNKTCQNEKFTLQQGDGKIILTAYGKSTHAAQPETGENAGVLAAQLLCSCEQFNKNDKEILENLCSLCACYDGSGVGISSFDENFQGNTFVLGISRCEEKIARFSFDCRFGRKISTADILSSVENAVEKANFNFVVNEVKDCYVTKTDKRLIDALLSVYAKMCDTNVESFEPFYSAGGTYARYLPSSLGLSIHNFAGLDILYPENLPDGHGQAHQADECISIDAFLKGIVTDAMIIYELDKMI